MELREERSGKAEEPEDIFEKVTEKKGEKKPAAKTPADKEKLQRDNQLDAAINLMKAIKTYGKEKA